MAFLLHNLPLSLLPHSSKSKEKPLHQTLSPSKPSSLSPLSSVSSSPLTSLQNSTSQVDTPPHAQHQSHKKDDFFLNLGLAVRTLREDLPLLFVKDLNFDIYRIWQPSGNEILIRWNLRGIPRVPWESKGEFQGTSRYKLDRNGKIYEHKVDNLAFNFPRTVKPVSVLDLLIACPASPNPTFLTAPVDAYSSWIELYRAVRETLHQEQTMLPQYGLATCS